MVLTAADALSKVKSMLYINDTTAFDSALTTSFALCVSRLFPFITKETEPQTVNITVDEYGEAIVDLTSLSTPIADVRSVECRQNGEAWLRASSIYRHALKLYIQEIDSDVVQARIFGLEKYLVADNGGTNEVDLPDEYHFPVFWFMMSEFYAYLAADRSRYNIYSQSLGARAVENLDSESEYYQQKAQEYLEDRAQMRGSQ